MRWKDQIFAAYVTCHSTRRFRYMICFFRGKREEGVHYGLDKRQIQHLSDEFCELIPDETYFGRENLKTCEKFGAKNLKITKKWQQNNFFGHKFE